MPIAILARTLATAALAASVSASTSVVNDPPADGSCAADTTYATQSSPGEVTLEVQPRWERGRLTVALRANTHSVELSSIDLAKSVRLVIGNTIVVAERAGSLNGHHARTTVTFDVPTQPLAFVIEIREVPDGALRRLSWPEP